MGLEINSYKNNDKELVKILVIISLTLLSLALLIAHESPAKGYELDIYLSTPSFVLIFIAFACGIIILYEWVSQGHNIGRIWLVGGLLILIVSRIILLYVPYTRGYINWWEDHISYLGMVKDILATGFIGHNNFYPITHIFLAEVTTVTGIKEATVVNLSTAFISIFFVLSIYLLAGAIFRDTRRRLLATLIAGSVLVASPYNVFLAPNGWSILILPFLYYLYFKQSSFSYRILLIIILLVYPFFHPLSCVIVIFSLFILAISRWFIPHAFNPSATLLTKISSSVYFFVEIIIFGIWVSLNPLLNRSVHTLWQQITMGIGSGQLHQLGDSLNKLNIHGIDILILIFKAFGAEIILALISAIGIIYLIRWIRDGTMAEERQNILPLSFIFIFCGALFVAYLLGLPGTQVGVGQQDRRFLAYFEILLPIFTTFGFYTILREVSFRKLVNISILFILIITSGLSIASLFPSPFIEQPNLQVTTMDMTGMKWFIEKKDQSIGCVFVSLLPFRFSDAILGYDVTHKQRLDISDSREPLPDHLGYPQHSSLGIQYPVDKYLTMMKTDRTVYTSVWKDVGRFDNIDFNKLERDFTVIKLYSNNEMDVYYIKSPVYP